MDLTPNKFTTTATGREPQAYVFYNRLSSIMAKIKNLRTVNHLELALIMLCISFLTAEHLEIAICYV